MLAQELEWAPARELADNTTAIAAIGRLLATSPRGPPIVMRIVLFFANVALARPSRHTLQYTDSVAAALGSSSHTTSHSADGIMPKNYVHFLVASFCSLTGFF